MDGNTFIIALALMLIFEGLMPLLHPDFWRQAFQRLLSFNNGQIRFIGLASLASGLLLLFIVV